MEPGQESEARAVKRRRGIYLLPNLLTTGALFFGFYAIIASIHGEFRASVLAMFAAMVLDGLDGRVARMTSTASEFGKEFDSLSDMVAFGLTPAVVTYQWGVTRLSEYGEIWGRLGWLATFLYVAATAFRLARFNSNHSWTDKRYFQGLASPAAAACVAATVSVSTEYAIDGLVALVSGITITALCALLMMSRFRYMSFKDIKPGHRVRYGRVILIPLVIGIVYIEPPLAVFVLACAYAASGPAFWIWRRLQRGTVQP